MLDTTSIKKIYEDRLLATWETVYKKGQLTLWVLLALQTKAMHMGEIKTFIENRTLGTLSADDKSMYRALRRFHQMDLVVYRDEPSNRGGPDRKVYSLTDTGQRVLRSFIDRNITNVYFTKENQNLLKGK